MKLGLQTACIMQSNLMSDIRLAKQVGFEEMELQTSKIERFIDAGFTIEDVASALDGFPVTMVDALYPFEPDDPEKRRQLRENCEKFSSWAKAVNCKTLQAVALDGLKQYDWREQRRKLADALRELADIAAKYDVTLGVEPIVFAPFHSIAQALEVFDATERDNVKLCADTFHLWTDRTPWDEVAKLDPNLIACAHLSDTNIKTGEQWADADRTALPGDGVVPMKEAVDAIKATGFDGTWSVEMMSKIHWEWDPEVLAPELKKRAEFYMKG